MAIDEQPCTTVHLWHDLKAVADARRALVRDLEQSGHHRRDVQDAVLVLSELASNAIEHGDPQACGHVEVTWCLFPDRARISVYGDIPSELGEEVVEQLKPRPPSQSAERGRGLAIVDHVCERWAAEATDGGVVVTAELAFGEEQS